MEGAGARAWTREGRMPSRRPQEFAFMGPGRSSDFFKVLRSSRSLDVAYSDQKECKTILLKLQLRVQFRTRTGFPFQSIIHERMMNHL